MSALQGWMVTGGQDIRLVEGGGGVEPVLVGQKTSRLQKGAPAYLPSYLAPQLPATWPLQQLAYRTKDHLVPLLSFHWHAAC